MALESLTVLNQKILWCLNAIFSGSWVPGRPGPLVWGDLEDKLEGQQNYYLTKHKHKLKITAREP